MELSYSWKRNTGRYYRLSESGEHNTLIEGQSVEKDYTAYTHQAGKIVYTLEHHLTGAEFTLYGPAENGQTENVLKIENDNYIPVSGPFAVNSDGIADIDFIKALHSGSYYLVETKAPSGYTAAEPMKVTLTINDSFTEVPGGGSGLSSMPASKPYNWMQEASLTLEGAAKNHQSDSSWEDISGTLGADSSGAAVYYKIPNNPGIVLPATGGTGTQLIYLLGSFLLILAGGLLLFQRKKERKL